jgi:CRP-like cAMP-binding protein/SAM-dependent methyltransferase
MISNANLAVISNTDFPAPRARRQRQTGTYAALRLLPDLSDTDVDWILSSGIEQQLVENMILVAEGQVPDALYFVLDGLLEVRGQSSGEDTLAQIGPGGIVGEMSFLEDQPAATTIRACENSLLLALSRKELDAKLATDAAFAARLYRSFARDLSRRLHGAQGTRRRFATGTAELTIPGRCPNITGQIEAMKRILAEADRQASKNDDQVPDDVLASIRGHFRAFCESFNQELGDASTASPELRREMGLRVQQEILPYMLLTKNGERWYSKPRGYAGDFLSIEWVYEDRAEGAGRIGPALDRCFLDLPAAQAVRNRRGLLVEEIKKTMDEPHAGPTRVLSMACGPAREIFDTFATLSDPNQLVATCLDLDLQALAFVADLRDRRKLKSNIRLVNSNLVYLATGRQTLDVAPIDLAYSIGLIDYFNDAFVVKLLDFVHDRLRPGGRVILGNFHPSNPSKAFMDHVLDWKLIHRDEADMNRLFQESKFKGTEEVRYEDTGINLFASGRRAS